MHDMPAFEIPSFGDWVQQERKALGLTQRALAAQVGCATVTIKKIEQAMRRPSDEMAALLAEKLQIPPTIREQFMALARGEALHQAAQVPTVVKASPIAPGSTPNQPLHHAFFVGRQRELALLEARFAHAMAGQAQIAFVTGEAGRGKTSLLMEFARRAQRQYPQLIIAGGSCNAFVGAGDPYLPFRDIIATLTGEVDARWRAATTERQITQLWRLLPNTVQGLIDYAPNLLHLLTTGGALVQRMVAHFPPDARWQQQLRTLVEQQARVERPHQQQIFEQMRHFLTHFARQAPLVLLLDDLQWADHASLNLLFHSSQRLGNSPILILGAFRASEVTAHGEFDPEPAALGEAIHPLWSVVNELQRNFGDIVIDLEQTSPTENRAFVDALIDSEANQLPPQFRHALFERTHGYPLFTIEVLRAMQEQGDLARDDGGQWVAGTALDWNRLPTRIEAVIRQRVERLPFQLQQILRIASIEGELFTAEVIAALLNCPVQEVIQLTSNQLGRQAQLVVGQGSQRVLGEVLSRYRFGHALTQFYLYQQLDDVERMALHEAVGTALERLYGANQEEIAPQLARHFEEAQLPEKAIVYRLLAGKRAIHLSAYVEAIAHLTKGLALLHRLPPSLARDQQELELQTMLGVPLLTTSHYGTAEVEQVYDRAYKLCLKIEQRPRPTILRALALAALVSGKYQRVHELATSLLALAKEDNDPMHYMEAHYTLGVNHFWLGNFVDSQHHLQAALTSYTPERQRAHLAVFAQDPKVVCLQRLAYTLWYLGYPTQAIATVEEALALADALAHPFTLAYVLSFSVWFYIEAEMLTAAGALLDRVIAYATDYRFPHWVNIGTILQLWLAAEQAPSVLSIAPMVAAMQCYRAEGSEVGWPFFQGLLARLYIKSGEIEKALAVIEKALQAADEHGDHWHDAELYRLRGELLFQRCAVRPSADQQRLAEAAFQQALMLAQYQQSKLLELRAAMSLCRLWQQQGKVEAAHEQLTAIYVWFTEGFETPDLQEAKALLEQLARITPPTPDNDSPRSPDCATQHPPQ